MAACVGCDSGDVALIRDFGAQPPSNRFLAAADAPEVRHRLALGQCERCALLQLADPMPVEMVRPRFDWLVYNEAEGHLDEVVSRLTRLPGIGAGSRIAGLTYKDDSTLARFGRLGFANRYRVDPREDLAILDPCAGLETIQAAVQEKRCQAIAARHGPADLLIARHVLEHAHLPRAFLAALVQLVRPGGYVVFEIPDCTKFVHACDYSFVWEEHVVYFSPATLGRFIAENGLRHVDGMTFPYAFEDSLVAVVARDSPAERATASATQGEPAEERAAGSRFGRRFEERRRAHRLALESARAAGRRVAIFGAGHLAARFVNLFELADLVSCVIDDNANKNGLRMPGSGLPIVGSSVLAEGDVDLCLLSLSPESERKLLARQADFTARGGEFRSIFALSPIALVPAAP